MSPSFFAYGGGIFKLFLQLQFVGSVHTLDLIIDLELGYFGQNFVLPLESFQKLKMLKKGNFFVHF